MLPDPQLFFGLQLSYTKHAQVNKVPLELWDCFVQTNSSLHLQCVQDSSHCYLGKYIGKEYNTEHLEELELHVKSILNRLFSDFSVEDGLYIYVFPFYITPYDRYR